MGLAVRTTRFHAHCRAVEQTFLMHPAIFPWGGECPNDNLAIEDKTGERAGKLKSQPLILWGWNSEVHPSKKGPQ